MEVDSHRCQIEYARGALLRQAPPDPPVVCLIFRIVRKDMFNRLSQVHVSAPSPDSGPRTLGSAALHGRTGHAQRTCIISALVSYPFPNVRIPFSARSRSSWLRASAMPGGSEIAKMLLFAERMTCSTRSARSSWSALRKLDICSLLCRCENRRPSAAASPTAMPTA